MRISARVFAIGISMMALFAGSSVSAQTTLWHTYLEQGREQFRAKKYEPAARLLDAALREAKSQNAPPEEQVKIEYDFGLALIEIDKTRDAEATLSDAMQLATRAGRKDLLSRIEYALGKTYLKEDRVSEAENALRNALVGAEKLDGSYGERQRSLIMVSLAEAFKRQGKTIEADALLKRVTSSANAGDIGLSALPEVAAEPPQNILILMDASIAMKDKLSMGGISKLEAAKQVILDFLQAVPTEVNVGLRVYGQGFSNIADIDCKKTTLLVRIGPGFRFGIGDKLKRVEAFGMAPLAYALQQAVDEDFKGVAGRSMIVIVADGTDTCGGNPCAYGQTLSTKKIRVEALGINANDAAKSSLQCLTDRCGGVYFDYSPTDFPLRRIFELAPKKQAATP
jgi:tetratricopeptide (TPR) repeat protein